MIHGLDTAGVADNGKVNWTAARAAGFRFALIRASCGLKPDKMFATYWPQLNTAGFIRGAYMFWRLEDDPVAQAEVFRKTVGVLEPNDLIAFDLEFPTNKKDPKHREGRASWGFTAEEARSRAEIAWDALKPLGVSLVYTSARIVDGPDLRGLPMPPEMTETPLWCVRRKNMVPKQWGGPTDYWISQDKLDIAAKTVPGFTKGDLDLDSFNPLYKGMTGNRVRWLQRQLGGVATGKFCSATEAALRDFQQDRGLNVDGIVGPATFAQF